MRTASTANSTRCAANGLLAAQRVVVRALLAGHTTSVAIGEALTISYGTVRSHLWRLFAKTGAVNMTDLVLMVLGRKPCPIDFSELRSELCR